MPNTPLPIKEPAPAAWMPRANQADQTLLAVQVPKAWLKSPIGKLMYLNLLYRRVKWLVSQEDNPKQAELDVVQAFERQGLAEYPPELKVRAGTELYHLIAASNPMLNEVLSLNGLQFPLTVTKGDPQALQKVKRVSLGEWIDHLPRMN